MIDRLIHFSVHQRILVLVLSVVFVVLGLIGASKVPIDAVPDVTNVQVQVLTPAPALGPEDVETYVSVPVERAMAGLPGLEEIRSTSRAGISAVTVVFGDGVELFRARQLVAERLSIAKRDIPPEYGSPELGPPTGALGEVFQFEVKGKASLMERRSVLDWIIVPRLRLVPGVVEVNTMGGEAKSLQVTLDPARLSNARVGVPEVLSALSRNHLATGGAYLVDGREHVTVRGEGRIKSPEDLGSVVVETREGTTPLFLRDLGEIGYEALVRYGAVTRDGRDDEAVVGIVVMLTGANSGQVVSAVRAEVEEVQKSLPPGIRIDVYQDRMDLVQRTIHTVKTNLLEASALVLLVLFVMLVSFRGGVVVAIAIPLALLGAFLGMWLGGVQGNLISLGAIDFGLVVDGAIIIVENAIRRMAERRNALGRPLTDEERKDTVISSSIEVRSATAFGEAIIALVYLPIVALQSVEGRMFRPMALTVLFALATAFVLSLTLVPALASLLLPRDAKDRESPIVHGALKIYRPVLRWATHRPIFVMLAALAAFCITIAIGSRMGREFLPQLDEGTLIAEMVRLPSVSLAQSLDSTRQTEKVLLSFPEVKSVVTRTGRAEVAVDPMGINMSDVWILLNPRDTWKTASHREGLIEAFDKRLVDEVPAAGFSYTQPIEMASNELLSGFSSDLAIDIYGSDLTALRKSSEAMVRTLRQIKGARDVRAEQIAGLNVLTVKADRMAIGRQGLDEKAVLDTVAAIGGVQVGEIVEGSARYPITVRFDAKTRESQDQLAALPVRTPSGALVPLAQLSSIDVAPGPSQISRARLQRRVTVQVNVRGRDIGSFVDEAKAAVEKAVKLPVGYFTVWAGEYERLQSATQQLAVVVPISLAVILVLLIATFGKVRPALLIFANVPMSVSGGILALLARDLTFSISAGIGFIALFGVAVLNGLVLVSSIEHLVAQGASIDDAVEQGATHRLRPVLTTAMVASLGFLPMALANGAGAEVQRPLATVVIGGLITSTLLTLVVLPSAYRWLLTPKAARVAASS
ncbi:MAG: efflux RND transporter permease subunit [Myxococcales bacterium]|nr:MAG: efflux RND transporter permease subunit [Myxococcales bacterium]